MADLASHFVQQTAVAGHGGAPFLLRLWQLALTRRVSSGSESELGSGSRMLLPGGR